MTDDDRRAFAECVIALQAAFGREPIEGMVEAWWIGLCDLPIEHVREACYRAIREMGYPPTVTEVRARCPHLDPLPLPVVPEGAKQLPVGLAVLRVTGGTVHLELGEEGGYGNEFGVFEFRRSGRRSIAVKVWDPEHPRLSGDFLPVKEAE